MSDVSHELERLAEADGATFIRSTTGAWWARDKEGFNIVRGALSKAEAARLYCEDKGLVASSPEAILEFIRAQYRPYDSMPEFEEGFKAYQLDGPHRLNPHGSTVAGQAWDRGANTAMLYQRALAHLDAVSPDMVAKDTGWLARLVRTGRA